jgi:hypothetical protein
MPLELTKLIMNIIFWKINWDFGADARVIYFHFQSWNRAQRRKSLKKLSIYQASWFFCYQKLRMDRPTSWIFSWTISRVQLWWSNWSLVHPKKMYLALSENINWGYVRINLKVSKIDRLCQFYKKKSDALVGRV